MQINTYSAFFLIWFNKTHLLQKVLCGQTDDKVVVWVCSRWNVQLEGSGTAIPVTLPWHFGLLWFSFAMTKADTWLRSCRLMSAVLSPCSDLRRAKFSLLGNKPTLKKFSMQGWLACIHHPPTWGIENAPYLPCGCRLDRCWEAGLLWNPP